MNWKKLFFNILMSAATGAAAAYGIDPRAVSAGSGAAIGVLNNLLALFQKSPSS